MFTSACKIFRAVYQHGVEALAGAMFVIILWLSWLQVFRRYALDNPATWTEEVARVLLVWLAFLAAAAATRSESHLAVDLLINRMPGRLMHLCRGLVNALVAAVGVILCKEGMVIAELALPDHSTSLGFSRSLFYLPAVAGGGLMAFYALVNAITHLRCCIRPATRACAGCPSRNPA